MNADPLIEKQVGLLFSFSYAIFQSQYQHLKQLLIKGIKIKDQSEFFVLFNNINISDLNFRLVCKVELISKYKLKYMD